MTEPLTVIGPPPAHIDDRNLEDSAPSPQERARRARVRQTIEELQDEKRRQSDEVIV